MHSHDFLERYTLTHTGPGSGLPMVTLRPESGPERICPFVSKKGCRVYPNRPSSCRVYPLARAISRNRQTGRIREQFALLKEAHCHGHEKGKNWTAAQWMINQQLDQYNRVNDQMMTLISLKNRYPGPLDRMTTRKVYTACYDLDTFRARILNNDWEDGPQPDTEARSRLAQDDLFLLSLGVDWAKSLITQEYSRSPQHA